MRIQSVLVVPLLIIGLLIAGLFGISYALISAITIGIVRICIDGYLEIQQGRYSLDYIALAAMVVAIVGDQYVAGAVVALMFTGGKALEVYATQKAYTALKSLGDSIPKKSFVVQGDAYTETPIQDIANGQVVLVKPGEIIPLDGTLYSTEDAVCNLVNLTGEIEPVVYKVGTQIKSGAINVGHTIYLKVVGDFSSSTYHKISKLVDEARLHPARIVHVSEKVNMYFTLITAFIALAAYYISGDIARLLAVLVIATPCPLIIAAPVAFIGGMSRLAKHGIIVRKPSALEVIARAQTIFFDKTGTLTMGEPAYTSMHIYEKYAQTYTESDVLSIAASIEINSLHPLARAIVHEAKNKNIIFDIATEIHEEIGKGIAGTVKGSVYSIGTAVQQDTQRGIVLSIWSGVGDVLADMYFTDTLKDGAKDMLSALVSDHVQVAVITGDTKENAERVFSDTTIAIHAESSPEDKYRIVDDAKKDGSIVVMVGDGLNDAPALSHAHAGVVFSGTENGASIEAADVVILDHQITKLEDLYMVSKRTMRITKQSIYGGVALSVVGMSIAAFGYIPPITGAFVQEIIDVSVILNALRVLRG